MLRHELSTPPPKPAHRNAVIDVLRGLLILLVVTGHTHSSYNILIYSFHMPAWFIISGYFHKNKSLTATIAHKAKTLLLPFFILNIGSLLLLYALQHVFHLELTTFPAQPSLKQLFPLFTNLQTTNELMGATWFLPVLFGVNIVATILLNLAERLRIPFPLTFGCSAILAAVGYSIGAQRYYLDIILFCQFFYFCGDCIHRAPLPLNRYETCALVGGSVLILLFQNDIYGQWFNIIGRRYNDVAVLLTTTCAGTYLMYCISVLLAHALSPLKNFLTFLGKNSFDVFMYHFACFKLFTVLYVLVKFPQDTALFKDFPTLPLSLFPYWYVYVIPGVALPLGLQKWRDWQRARPKTLSGCTEKGAENSQPVRLDAPER